METYKINNLTFKYPLGEKYALDNINLTVNSGEFITICGKSGCGKSTLLRHLKTVLTPYGEAYGEILFCGKPLECVDERTQASKIGYVLQNPDNQIVTDKVWHELAFGLESLGFDNNTIRLRVAEMASFFGIQSWFYKNVSELSGGQKQLLNLASIMAMQPHVLILDEPTSQLDPIAAADFLETVKKINIELGTTIIMTEHRLEEIFHISDRIIVMDNAKIIASGKPSEVGEKLKEINHDMFMAMPTPMQIYFEVKNNLKCPVTVRDGRNWLSELIPNANVKRISDIEKTNISDIAIKIKEVFFRYEKNAPDVVKNLSFEVRKGQLSCIVGGNGTGKTTVLSLISGINKAQRGKIWIDGQDISKLKNSELFSNNLGVLPQNPQGLFVKKTVELDLNEILSDGNLTDDEKNAKILEISNLVEIQDLMARHPYDLSGGEQQRVALAKVLLLNPKILLLDEPTKCLDSHFKAKLATILKKLLKSGVTIVMVSHDIEFCAKYADVCSMFFDGSVITSAPPKVFFSGNSFYTTSANRMSRHIFENTVTIEDVIKLCKLNGA